MEIDQKSWKNNKNLKFSQNNFVFHEGQQHPVLLETLITIIKSKNITDILALKFKIRFKIAKKMVPFHFLQIEMNIVISKSHFVFNSCGLLYFCYDHSGMWTLKMEDKLGKVLVTMEGEKVQISHGIWLNLVIDGNLLNWIIFVK